MDYVKGSRILRERLGRVRQPPVEWEQDAVVSREATARIRRWIGAEPAPASPPASTARSGRLKKRRR